MKIRLKSVAVGGKGEVNLVYLHFVFGEKETDFWLKRVQTFKQSIKDVRVKVINHSYNEDWPLPDLFGPTPGESSPVVYSALDLI